MAKSSVLIRTCHNTPHFKGFEAYYGATDSSLFRASPLRKRTRGNIGAPLCAVIENTNTRSGDYSGLMNCPRPAHADYTAYIKYHAANDVRGGGGGQYP